MSSKDMSDKAMPADDGSANPGGMKPDNKKFAMRAARYTSMAMSLPGAVLAGYFIGYALDAWLHTTFLKVVFLILGIVSGFAQLFQLLEARHAARREVPQVTAVL